MKEFKQDIFLSETGGKISTEKRLFDDEAVTVT
jgi:hypothetical protein